MIRLSFAARLALIVVFSLLAIQLIAILVFFAQRGRDTQTGFRLPFPDQVAAIVALVEAAGGEGEERSKVLRAVNNTNFRAHIVQGKPQMPSPEGWARMDYVEMVLKSYLVDLGERDVAVFVEAVHGPLMWQRPLSYVSSAAIEVQVGLKTGETLVIHTKGIVAPTIFGFPLGFFAGVLGFAISVLTIWIVRREAKPLRQLVRSVDTMELSTHTTPIAPAPRSAPEIQALIAAFNRLRERIAGLLKARMALVGGISHDLRTYATRLRLRAELIPDEREREKAVRDIDEMIALLDDALLAIRQGTASRDLELVELGEVLRREVEDRRLQGAEISLSTAWTEGQQVLGDALSLRRLISNVTDNAIIYGGCALIRAFSVEGEATIIIEDRGPGIKAELREQVMEPFVRLETSRSRKTGGAGLGLAIARNIAEAHGGKLAIGEASGGGAKVTITLPLFSPAAM